MSSASKGHTSGYSSLLNLEEQFTFYSSYHNDRYNVAIHLLCVWPILWTGLALLAALPSMGSLPPDFIEHLPFRPEAWALHLGSSIVLLYTFFYCILDPIAGGLASVMVLSCYVTSNLWVADGGSIALAGAVHLAGWAAQVYGHSVHERRAPALVDNLFQVFRYLYQAFLAAPLFVLFEVLFVFGYRPGLKKRVKTNALRNIKEYRAALASNATGNKQD